jgi:hypothetical protein
MTTDDQYHSMLKSLSDVGRLWKVLWGKVVGAMHDLLSEGR